MTLETFTVGIAQMSPRLGDVEHNLGLYEDRVREARNRGVDLLVFPELSLTGYALRDLVATVALRRDSKEMKRLAELSREVALVAGLVEETDDFSFYNSTVYFEEGFHKHTHRKVYLPTYGMFDEQRYFARGDRFRAFDSKFGRSALLVCEDLWHPSAPYVVALDGASMILCSSTSPLRGLSADAPADDNARTWEMLNTFYARVFGLYVVYANRVGFEDGVGFWGGSEVIDPFGERIAKAHYYDPDFITATVSLETVRRKRVMTPLLRDEDIELTINELLRLSERPSGRETSTSRRARKPPASAAGKAKGVRASGARSARRPRRR